MKNLFLLVCILTTIHVRAQQQFISLAGRWAVRIDSTDVGEREGWYAKPSAYFSQPIQLPGTLDDAGLGNPVPGSTCFKERRIAPFVAQGRLYRGCMVSKRSDHPYRLERKVTDIFLERVIWQTRVWIDGQPLNSTRESLVAPHVHESNLLFTPGKHTITIRVDNRRKHDISLGDANFAHAYTNETQTIWNGVIGKIGIQAREKVFIQNVQVYPDAASNSVKAVVQMYNSREGAVSSKLQVLIGSGSKAAAAFDTAVVLQAGNNELVTDIKLKQAVNTWDEFKPVLYNMMAVLEDGKKADTQTTVFGFRKISSVANKFAINGRPLFLRGTLECSIFPKLGHTPMDKSGWLKVFNTAKSYGLNHLRFHSWCPPEAAFAVADQLGFYLQVELPVWSLKIGKDDSADQFLQSEADQIIRNYGNHPSFCFWSMGNEMQGDMQWLSKQVNALKIKDPRRLYTTTTFTFEEGYGKWPVQADDYFITQYTKKGWIRGQGIFDSELPTFNKDYRTATDSMPVPLISHEIGQYAVFPNMKEIGKYNGVLKPINFLAVQQDLSKKNLLPLANSYTNASGKLALLLYKEEIERALKTTAFSGFQLLDLHDFPGQGTALVGILDAFWESKGLISPADFRKFCSPVVPLIRYPKATYTNDETFAASIELANYGSEVLNNKTIAWSITTADQQVIATGKFAAASIGIGNGISIGNISASLIKVTTAQKLTIAVRIVNTSYRNDWNIWVYPKNNPVVKNEVEITSSLHTALEALRAGKRVLLNPAKENINGVEGKFVQVFWSPVHFPNQPGTMGLTINPAHPAFKYFPTDAYTNWQWWDLCKNSTTMVLDSTGINSSAIVLRNIDNFFKNRQMASIIEAKVGKGKLLLCAMNITDDLENRTVARQLQYSLLRYMNSPLLIQ